MSHFPFPFPFLVLFWHEYIHCFLFNLAPLGSLTFKYRLFLGWRVLSGAVSALALGLVPVKA